MIDTKTNNTVDNFIETIIVSQANLTRNILAAENRILCECNTYDQIEYEIRNILRTKETLESQKQKLDIVMGCLLK